VPIKCIYSRREKESVRERERGWEVRERAREREGRGERKGKREGERGREISVSTCYKLFQ